jgi:hypothetical protein
MTGFTLLGQENQPYSRKVKPTYLRLGPFLDGFNGIAFNAPVGISLTTYGKKNSFYISYAPGFSRTKGYQPIQNLDAEKLRRNIAQMGYLYLLSNSCECLYMALEARHILNAYVLTGEFYELIPTQWNNHSGFYPEPVETARATSSQASLTLINGIQKKGKNYFIKVEYGLGYQIAYDRDNKYLPPLREDRLYSMTYSGMVPVFNLRIGAYINGG